MSDRQAKLLAAAVVIAFFSLGFSLGGLSTHIACQC